jgi:hypothetical protein
VRLHGCQVLWNIDSPADTRVGQAVLISHWEFEDGTRGGPGAPVDEGELEPAGWKMEAGSFTARIAFDVNRLQCTACNIKVQMTWA